MMRDFLFLTLLFRLTMSFLPIFKQKIPYPKYCGLISLSILLHVSCLNVAQDRSALEERIGHAQLTPITVSIKDGLASIRKLNFKGESLNLELWAQAPRLEINIEYASEEQSAVSLELHLYNIMSDSQVLLLQDSAEQVVSVEYTSPTLLSGTLSLQPGRHQIHIIPPQPDSNQSWKFGLFADVQERLNGVADLFVPLGQENLKFALISGDLTRRGAREELEEFQRQQLQHLPFPCYATLGNHELGTEGVPFYHYFGRGSFSFEYGGARFTLIDGASASIAPRTQKSLNLWLDEGIDQLHILATHIPLLDPDGTRGGSHASRLEAAALISEFQAHNLDLLLYGHVHTYRYFYQAGIPTIISGGGGSIPMRLDGIGRHYVVFEVNSNRNSLSHLVQRIYPEE
ncbi:MAG: metallophosphoesterase [Myxococcales bacterium]|nr:metallophosphoesterase [Myxococcales bacterium]